MKIPHSCDVVVVGGGPAGSTTATLLAQKGYQVVLFDKQKHPRYVVGESLIPDFWKYTDSLGVSERIMNEGFVPKSASLVNWDGDHHLLSFAEFGYTRAALHVERDSFDHILLSHAQENGVTVFEEVSVRHIEFTQSQPVEACCHYVVAGNHDALNGASNGVNQEIVGTIHCRYVVDASGQSALLGRQLGLRKINEAFRFLSVWGQFKGGRYFDKTGHAHPVANYKEVAPTTYVTSIAEFDHVGWCWHFPLRDIVSVGITIPLKYAKSPKAESMSWDDYFHEKCRALPIVNQLLEDAEFCPDSVRTTRDFSYHSTQVAGPGYFLVGDAAGFIDPVFSIGVVLGFYTGHAAAWAIDRSLCNPDRAATYRNTYARQTQGRFDLARSLAVPRYEANPQIDALAKDSMRLAGRDAQALMHTVSVVTGRSENFTERAAKVQHVADRERLITIDKLTI